MPTQRIAVRIPRNQTDPDAQAFITAAGITDSTQQSAINTLVVNLKAYGIWTKMKALYPFVGGTAASHKFNLKDPRDLDVAFRLVFNGGWTHSVNGATPNGTNGYANTFYNTSTQSTTSNVSAGFYSRTNTTSGGSVFGALNGYPYYNGLQLSLKHTDNNTYWAVNDYVLTGNANIVSDTRGFFILNKISLSQKRIYRNGSSIATSTPTNNGTANYNIFLGARNLLGSAETYDTRQHSFTFLGDTLTDTEAANFYTAVQAFQVALGRSIGTQTVSDADAQAFVNAANITDQVEATAINNLVVGLKADSIWTKMKALYPFVGGTAASHKFNLKNTSTATLTFNGGWTHSNTGATPNGTNAYADTFLTPSLAFNTTTFNHLSYYSRSNTAKTAEYVMGAYNGVGNHGLIIRRDTNLGLFVADYASSTSFRSAVGSVTDGRGLFLGSQTGANAKLYRNGSVIYSNTSATLNAAAPNNKIFIGALNETGIGSFTDKQCAFASIGEGLTDTEAANFYTRVQAFQTTLGRQV